MGREQRHRRYDDGKIKTLALKERKKKEGKKEEENQQVPVIHRRDVTFTADHYGRRT